MKTFHPEENMESFSLLFASFGEQALKEIFKACNQITLSVGEYLFHQGDQSETLYLVLTGRLRAIIEKEGQARILGDIPPGEPIGEFAFFTGEPRTAAALAIRKSTVLELRPDVYKRLVSDNPQLATVVTRMIINRLKRNTFEQTKSQPPKNIALLNLNKSCVPDGLLHMMKEWFIEQGTAVRVLDGTQFEAEEGDAFFDDIEKKEGVNLMLCHEDQKLWTKQAIVYSDLVVVMAPFSMNPALTECERNLNLYARNLMNKKVFLVLIHPTECTIPINTQRWLKPRNVDLHIHVREDHHRDIRRLCRILTNKAFGLVLGGGGAKGFAHIGVVKALLERNVEIDFLGGTSAGALYGIGMCYADFDFAQIQNYAEEGARQKLTSNDFTLPMVSIMSGKKFSGYIRQMFGDHHLEDIWINCFCVSANYSQAKLSIHDKGLIWKHVWASMAIPGLFPPVVIDQDLHVDGGVMDNLPIEPMYKYPVDSIFASSLSNLVVRKVDFTESPTAWQLICDIFRKKNRYSLPGITSILANSMTLNSTNKQEATKEKVSHYFELNLKGVGMLEDSRWKEISEMGYQQAKVYLEKVGLGR